MLESLYFFRDFFLFVPPLSDESDVVESVKTGLDSSLFSFCGGVVLLSKSSELSDSASSSQTLSSFCNVLAC